LYTLRPEHELRTNLDALIKRYGISITRIAEVMEIGKSHIYMFRAGERKIVGRRPWEALIFFYGLPTEFAFFIKDGNNAETKKEKNYPLQLHFPTEITGSKIN